MNKSVLHNLEFDKIRVMLADAAGSALGKELAEALEPDSGPDEVRRRLTETGEAVDISIAALNVPLGGIRDIRAILRRAEIDAVLDGGELAAVGATLYASRRIRQFFGELPRPAPLLEAVAAAITVLRPLETAIETAIGDAGVVQDSASPELARIRRDIRTTQNRVKEKLDAILHSAQYQKYFQDALVTIRGDRYVIPVKQEYRQYFPGIVHDQSASGATVFIEPMPVVNLNNDLKQLVAAEENEVERILRLLTAQVAAAAGALRENCRALGHLDFAFAKARLALKMNAIAPRINEQGIIALRQARHPLIPAATVVPIDIRIGRDFQILVITGPNTGGKTVSLKTAGLFALMTQAGLFIPAAADSEMPVFREIFADIGDEQSIEQSLSTFSAHMTKLVAILGQVTAADLVLIDEVGAGTDPDEGAALAMAILEHLHTVGARTIATTHYSELKTFAYSRHGIENASVEFDIQTLRPAYRLQIGVPGSSKAFLISGRLGLDSAIIERAKQLIDEDYAEFDQVLTDLEGQKRQLTVRQDEAAALRRELDELRAALARERETLAAKKEQILGKAQREAETLLRQVRLEAEELITQLKAQFGNKSGRDRQQAVDGVRRRLRKNMETVRELDDGEEAGPGRPAAPEELVPGTEVYVPSLEQKGTVVSLSGGEVILQMGIMKINVPAANCRLLKQSAPEKRAGARSTVHLAKAQDTPRQIDIRGTTIEEAETILDKYLDDAILAGLGEVLVIHGKGTGALRRGVREYLKAHRSVRGIQIAELNEGGDGATVAKLS